MTTVWRRVAVLLGAAALGWTQESAPPAGEIPAGTVLAIRLRQTVASYGSRRGGPVTAMVIAPVTGPGGRTLLPARSVLHGHLTEVRRVGLGLSHEVARIGMVFEELTVPGGEPIPLAGRLSAVDDARETVDALGRIEGIRATASFSSVVSGLAVSAASVDPMLLGFALASSLSIFRIPESEILLPAGAELRFTLTAPLRPGGAFGPRAPEYPATAAAREELAGRLRAVPFRTATAPDQTPSDLTSLLYVGSESALARAFAAAGWTRSDQLDRRSTYGAIRAVVENQGYKEAPMSTLLLEGAKPTFTFAKTLDTFFKRHHLRIYPAPAAGPGVWTSTATHDSGIGFSKRARTLIHIIDENIDEEREKVINDLILTGCVAGVGYLDRPWVPRDARNATGDTLRTDGRIGVVQLNACEHPERADTPEAVNSTVRQRQAAALRPVRNTLLTLRNDFYRGNIVYQAVSGVRLVHGVLRNPPGGPAPRTISYGGEQFEVVTGAAHPEAPRESHQAHRRIRRDARPPDYRTLIDFSFNGGYARFGNDRFSTQIIDVTFSDAGSSPFTAPVQFVTDLRPGWVIAPKITFHPARHFSHEFGFSFHASTLRIRERVEGGEAQISFGTQIRQFSYNTLIQLRPNGARIRPYLAAGPVIQLIRPVDSQPGTNSVLKFAVKDLSLIVGAYEFGSKPPLEGGGIFQAGLQYGAGCKFQMTPKFFLRTDFRETLSPQPDFWSGSAQSFRDLSLTGPLQFAPRGLTLSGPLRQQQFTVGVGISF